MEIFFRNPDEVPLPPEEVRIREFRVEPRPDGRRVRVYLEVTAFLKRPNGEIRIYDEAGEEAASVNIIETIDPKMEFTMHLRGQQMVGAYTAAARIFYMEEAEGGDPEEEAPFDPSKQKEVDRRETKFEIRKDSQPDSD